MAVMVHCWFWTELTDISSYGASCVYWMELTDSNSYDPSCVLHGTDRQEQLLCVGCLGRNCLTVAVVVHRVCWKEPTDRSSYGALCVLVGTA